MVQAKWNDLTFALDAEGARQLRSISRRTALKVQAQEDIVGSGSTVTKGLEPFAAELVFTTSAASGCDIPRLYTIYESYLGESDFLYLNDEQFYSKKLQLISVDVQNMQLDGRGRVLSADFRLSLREYTPEQKRQRVNKSAGNARKRPPAATAEQRARWLKGISGTEAKPTKTDKANQASKNTSRP